MYGSDSKVKVKCPLKETEKVHVLFTFDMGAIYRHIDPQGQWISPSEKGDGLDYHCLNRRDENPFLKKANTTTDNNSWLENVNSTCPNGEDYRRCLGNRADECVGKYNISRK